MQLKFEQLREHLKQGIQPIYFVFGDEPLQMRDATDMIRKAANYYGYSARECFNTEISFNWSQLLRAGMEQSLFADKKLIELHLHNAKPSDKGEAINNYCQRPAQDTVLLIHCGKLDKTSRRSKWFKTLEQSACCLAVYPKLGQQLTHWLEQRLRSQQLNLTKPAIDYLSDHVQGNMLAADQEIIKLRLNRNQQQLEQGQVIELDELVQIINDDSVYQPFDLFDTVLRGDCVHIVRMLRQFAQGGTAIQLLISLLTKEVRTMCSLQWKCSQMPLSQAMQQVYIFPQRRRFIETNLQSHPNYDWQSILLQLARLERFSKGLNDFDGQKENEWNALSLYLLAIAKCFSAPNYPKAGIR